MLCASFIRYRTYSLSACTLRTCFDKLAYRFECSQLYGEEMGIIIKCLTNAKQRCRCMPQYSVYSVQMSFLLFSAAAEVQRVAQVSIN